MPSTRLRRTLLSARWLHNWISVFIGVVLVAWVVSGLFMIHPDSPAAMAGQGTGRPVDWSAVTVAPAQAAQVAQAASGTPVRSVTLQPLRDGLVYLVRTEGGQRRYLVDATSAAIVTVTESLAVAISGDALPGTRVARVERLEQGGAGYSGPPLPAFHIVYADQDGTEGWVSAATGEVRRSTRADRRRSALGHSVHVFTPLRRMRGGERTRKGALWATSLVSLGAMALGYWLALPRRWRSKIS